MYAQALHAAGPGLTPRAPPGTTPDQESLSTTECGLKIKHMHQEKQKRKTTRNVNIH